MNRAELIASLVTDKYSGFKDGDEPILEAAADARLSEFRAAADAAKVAVGEKTTLNTELTNTKARLKVAEDRIKASETQLTREEFIARAPEDIKTLLASHKAQQDSEKASLISALKTCGVKTEDELNRLDIPELKTLAKFARIQVIDYSSRGLPVQRDAEEANTRTYAPPNPYEAGVKALQTAGK
jgi:hypothetical protein